MTARTAVAVLTGCPACYLHGQNAPWPAMGTVPILEMSEQRNAGAYLLCRAWWFLAPLVTGTTLAAATVSAWAVLGPAT